MIRSDEAEDIINNSNKLEKEKSKLVAFDIKVDLDDSTVRKYITLHLNPRYTDFTKPGAYGHNEVLLGKNSLGLKHLHLGDDSKITSIDDVYIQKVGGDNKLPFFGMQLYHYSLRIN